MTAEPTLAADEARLAEIAAELEAALIGAVPVWLRRIAAEVSPDVDPVALEDAIGETMEELAPEICRVLRADVDAGAGNPLATVRAATGRVTDLLVRGGAWVPRRDDFDAQAFPDDVFGFGPAAFADIDPTLHERGLMWGAARAHVHLRRRREHDT